VDLGVKTLATLSDGSTIANPKHLAAAQRRLARAGRLYARTIRGSAGRSKAADRLARLHVRVANLRADSLHQLSARLARDYETVVLEDLNVAGMLRNHRLARVINDAGFAELRRQLEYKTTRQGGTLVIVDRFYPSSKTCSNCGTVKTKLSLSERTYRCRNCGTTIDRDLNAAINLHHHVAGSGPETTNGGRAPQKTRTRGQQAKKPQPRTH